MKRISAKDNPLIKHINKLIKSAKYRVENNEFIAEGARLCEDALVSDAEISALLVSDSAVDSYPELIDELLCRADSSYILPDSLFSKISDTQNPQGLLCVIKALDKPILFDKIKSNGKILALDNIQDPSNLGTILRTAEAVGIDGVVLSKDCCDIHSPKVVRGSMGAVFRISYEICDNIADFLKSSSDITAYGAVVNPDATKITEINFSGKCSCVVIGNEANGIKKATAQACDVLLTIPMNGRAESLNASIAAGIIMWEMVK